MIFFKMFLFPTHKYDGNTTSFIDLLICDLIRKSSTRTLFTLPTVTGFMSSLCTFMYPVLVQQIQH